MFDHESFVTGQISKAEEYQQRQKYANMKEENELRLFEYLKASQVVGIDSMVDFNGILCLIDQKKNEIERKLNQISIEEGLAHEAEIVDGGDQAVDHTQMLDTTVHTMKNEHSNMEFNNNGLLPFGDANIP